MRNVSQKGEWLEVQGLAAEQDLVTVIIADVIFFKVSVVNRRWSWRKSEGLEGYLRERLGEGTAVFGGSICPLRPEARKARLDIVCT